MEGLTTYQRAALELIMERTSSDPVTGKDVANSIGLRPRRNGKDGADMRSVINALRVKGYPVCASGGGYWWPSSQEELSQYVVAFDQRIGDQIKARDGLKSGFDKVGHAQGREAIAKVSKVFYRAEGKVFEILASQVPAFLNKYPDAEKV